MPLRRRARLPLAAAAGGLALLAAAAPAGAALPVANGRYTGPSSQGSTMLLHVARGHGRSIDEFSGNVRLACGKLGTLRDWSLTVDVPIRRGGTFSDTFVGPTLLPQLMSPVSVDGTRHRVFAVSRTELAGRFLDRRHAQGTWREQVLVLDRSAFDDPTAPPLDGCDTGVLTWKVKLRG